MQHDTKDSGALAGETQKSPAQQAAEAVYSEAAATAAAEAGAGGTEPGFEPGPEQMRAIIEALQGENDQLRAALDSEKDQGLRLRAEMENMRKRSDREKADLAKYAISKFAGDMVDVAENFARALASVPAEATADNPTLKALQDGVSMTEREFLKMLDKHGVKRIDPTGGPFNPHLHQAVMEQDNPQVPAGTVVQVFQAGYTIEDRVLRPAMVVVARGGPKPARPADAPQAANDDAAPDAGQAPTGNGPA